MGEWRWDPTLYAGSASFYPVGRVPYPPELGERVAHVADLDGHGTLVDVGCGPGSLTLLLAPHVRLAVGVDADPDMLLEAERQAAHHGVTNVRWQRRRAEELPGDLPPAKMITFAQSLHWMESPRVARIAHDMLAGDGLLVHVHATTHEGVPTHRALRYPQPPREAVRTLVRRYLGTTSRAGRTVRPAPSGPPRQEDGVYRAAGFHDRRRLEFPARVVERRLDEVRASIYSLSWSAPHLFANEFDAFDTDLRSVLERAAPDGRFSELMRGVTVDLWRHGSP